MLAEGFACGLHRIERLMQLQALRARPRMVSKTEQFGPATQVKTGTITAARATIGD
jgi:hypothetical protein